jgi:uncharacterized protein (TIGR00297 family)
MHLEFAVNVKSAGLLPGPVARRYDEVVTQIKLVWQSKLVLLLVLPFAGASIVLQGHFFAVSLAQAAIWTLGLSLLLGLIVAQLRAATPGGAFAGAVLTACLMFSTASLPYQPWRTALVPVMAVFVVTWIGTLLGRERKERLGTAERRQGRTAAQVTANLGVAAMALNGLTQSWLADSGWFSRAAPMLMLAVGLAALAEAAADTSSSEVGQVLGGRPRMITTLHQVGPGTDGAVSLVGTLAGLIAAGIVSGAGALALGGGWAMFWISCAGAVFGLFFDSLLGATLERRGWLNNDAVNFLSTASAAGFAMGVLALLLHLGVI